MGAMTAVTRGTQRYYSFILRDSQALGIRGQRAPAIHEERIVFVQTPVGASGQRQWHFWRREHRARAKGDASQAACK